MTDALVHFAILGLTVPEALKAIGTMQDGEDTRTADLSPTT